MAAPFQQHYLQRQRRRQRQRQGAAARLVAGTVTMAGAAGALGVGAGAQANSSMAGGGGATLRVGELGEEGLLGAGAAGEGEAAGRLVTGSDAWPALHGLHSRRCLFLHLQNRRFHGVLCL